MGYEVRPLTPDDPRGWEAMINGQPVTVDSIDLSNEKVGIRFQYGIREEGYDGMVIRERGGGGAATVPYMFDRYGNLYIGMVLEKRTAMGGYVWNIPRGLLDIGEDHNEAALREAAEETGLTNIHSRVFEIASGVNPNSAYFDTTDTDEEPNAGVSFHAVEFFEDELIKVGNEYRFPDDITPIDNSSTGEKIITSRFKGVWEAIYCRDMFSMAAIGALVISLTYKDQYIPKHNAQPVAF